MDSPENSSAEKKIQSRYVIHLALQIIALVVLIGWCFQILAPFFNPLLWGAILAVSLFPLHNRLRKLLKGRKSLAAIIVCLLMMIVFLTLTAFISIKTGSEIETELAAYRQGKIKFPPPPAKLKDFPVVGSGINDLWKETSKGIGTLVEKHPDQAKAIAGKMADLLASVGKGLVIFALSIIICGFFLAYSEESAGFAKSLFGRMINSKIFDMAEISAITIRNVVKGILGVSLIQSLLAGLGFVVAGIPYAGLLALVCLILAIIQIGIMPVSIGVLIYIWSTASTTTSILFTLWMIPIGLLDNILKPLLMGKGAPVPMLVIFLGSLGGFIYSGFIGLFTGAVILSLGYRLFDVWLKESQI
ncbi:MAG: AI-2E family transporter [Chitinophagales bacterium]